MASRSDDWMEQARRDVETAGLLRAQGRHEWAAFISQQAAEKALKAVFQSRGRSVWGHAVVDLLVAVEKEIGIAVPPAISPCAKRLDRNYIQSRYPDSWAEGAPHRYYDEADADDAIRCAGEILRFCEGLLVRS